MHSAQLPVMVQILISKLILAALERGVNN